MADDSNSRYADWKAYEYNPSTVAAAIFMLLFLLSTVLHSYQLFRTRTWFFIPVVIGGWCKLHKQIRFQLFYITFSLSIAEKLETIVESIGYVCRLISSRQSPDWALGPYIIQSAFILVAPALFAASIYMELGRIIVLVRGENHSVIRVNWLTKIFVAGDVFSFLMQSSGAGLMVKSDFSKDTAENIIVGGLFVQVIFFCLFIVSAVLFQRRIGKSPTDESHQLSHTWRKHMYALFSTSLLILTRSIVRVVEYLQGQHGYLLQHEVFLYVFDAVFMFSVMVIFNVLHPSEINCLLGRGAKMMKKGGIIVSEFELRV
ncbi:hypothetical protein FQN52_009128 [Onygenales sp. PD_12]|nr:hypothetical protein FQN52_009128 [Onygenales sp. PD_12]